MYNTSFLNVELTPEIEHNMNVTYMVTGKSFDEYGETWTADGIIKASYLHQTKTRSAEEKISPSFDIACSPCMFKRVPTTYGELASSPDGRLAIKAQIKSHRTAVKTLSRRIKQKTALLNSTK